MTAGDHRLPGPDRSQRTTFLPQSGTGCAVNGAGYSPAWGQLGVRGVHDALDVGLLGDVSFDNFDFHGSNLFPHKKTS